MNLQGTRGPTFGNDGCATASSHNVAELASHVLDQLTAVSMPSRHQPTQSKLSGQTAPEMSARLGTN